MNQVVIVDAARTAIGSYGGGLKDFSASQLGSIVLKELVERNGIESKNIDHIIMGCAIQNGENSYAARKSALLAGIDPCVPAVTVNRLCGSALEAVNQGAMQIQLGVSKLCIAGGTESMTNSPYLSYSTRWGARLNPTQMLDGMVEVLTDPVLKYHMGVTAENLAEKYSISREEQDEFALASHKKCSAAINSGKFDSQIIPIEYTVKGKSIVVDKDESVRSDISIEKLGKLKPAFKKDGTVTAGNASGLNDAAAAVILAEEDYAVKNGLKIRARIKGYAVVGVNPEIMGIGPVNAIKKVLKEADLTMEDIDLFECNEAFASQSIAVARELNIDPKKLNVNGGAIAHGHPLGASGAVIFTKALCELERIEKKYAVVALCIGGGQGIATIIERV